MSCCVVTRRKNLKTMGRELSKMRDRTTANDLTTGNITGKMVAFALPIMAMNLLQAVYNIVDMIIVGQFVGSAGMSAVSIGGQITTLVLVLCAGLSNGCSVMVANRFGMHQEDEIKTYVGSMLSFLLIAAAALTVLSVALRDPLLHVLKTPAESYAETRDYLTICMLGTVFVYAYGLLSAALRGIGESVHPLMYVCITTAENILLDLLFVGVLHRGAGGAAEATVISQITSAILVARYTKRRTGLFDFHLPSFRINGRRLRQTLAVGLPQAIQFICTNISFLLIIALINAYGVVASAAAGAATKLGTFGLLPGQACMTAIVTMTAQNLPQENYARIRKGLFCGIGLSLAFAGVFFLLCQVFPAAMYGLFTSDPAVSEMGTGYLRLYALSFLDETVMFCLFGVLTGAGYTLVTMAAAISQAFLIRYAVAFLLSRYTALGFQGIAAAYSAAPLLGITVSVVFLLSGRWKKPGGSRTG